MGSAGGGVWGRIWEYREFGGIWRSVDGWGIGGFLVVWGVGSSMRAVWKERGNVLWCGKVWREVWESVLEVKGDVEGMGNLSPHFSHFPPHSNTLPHSFHILPILDPTLRTTRNSPILPPSMLPPNSLYSPILPHTPPPRTPHSCFIIYPIPKFLNFLIYCQSSPAIKLVHYKLLANFTKKF